VTDIAKVRKGKHTAEEAGMVRSHGGDNNNRSKHGTAKGNETYPIQIFFHRVDDVDDTMRMKTGSGFLSPRIFFL
jgi:hypothetical protein